MDFTLHFGEMSSDPVKCHAWKEFLRFLGHIGWSNNTIYKWGWPHQKDQECDFGWSFHLPCGVDQETENSHMKLFNVHWPCDGAPIITFDNEAQVSFPDWQYPVYTSTPSRWKVMLKHLDSMQRGRWELCVWFSLDSLSHAFSVTWF